MTRVSLGRMPRKAKALRTDHPSLPSPQRTTGRFSHLSHSGHGGLHRDDGHRTLRLGTIGLFMPGPRPTVTRDLLRRGPIVQFCRNRTQYRSANRKHRSIDRSLHHGSNSDGHRPELTGLIDPALGSSYTSVVNLFREGYLKNDSGNWWRISRSGEAARWSLSATQNTLRLRVCTLGIREHMFLTCAPPLTVNSRNGAVWGRDVTARPTRPLGMG